MADGPARPVRAGVSRELQMNRHNTLSLAALLAVAMLATGCASTRSGGHERNSNYYSGNGGRITGSRTADAAIGGTAGAILGNQIGRGNGQTLATAAGAATGAAMASGCDMGAGTALGATAGGLIGALVGHGQQRNAAAAIGASLGAVAGSDCR